MFKKRVKDSITVAKHMKIVDERTLKIDRKRALYILILEGLFLIGLIVSQWLSNTFYSFQFGILVIASVSNSKYCLTMKQAALILLSIICGFNIIFYVDQTRLGTYKCL